ncbi:Protein argonaute 14, partial [Taenia solium]
LEQEAAVEVKMLLVGHVVVTVGIVEVVVVIKNAVDVAVAGSMIVEVEAVDLKNEVAAAVAGSMIVEVEAVDLKNEVDAAAAFRIVEIEVVDAVAAFMIAEVGVEALKNEVGAAVDFVIAEVAVVDLKNGVAVVVDFRIAGVEKGVDEVLAFKVKGTKVVPFRVAKFVTWIVSKGIVIGYLLFYLRESLMSLSVAGDVSPDQQIVTAPPSDTGSSGVTSEPRGPKKQPATSSLALKEDRMLPSRPGVGTVGRRMMVEVNCWDCVVSDVSVLMYDITPTKLLSGDGKEIRLKEKDLRKHIKAIAERKRGDVFHDGGRILFSLGPLDGRNEETLTFSEKIPDPLGNDDLTIEYTAKRVGSVSASLIFDYLANGRSKTSDIPQPAINMLDNLIKWVNKASFPYLSKSAIFYGQPERSDTGSLFWIYRGYSLSFRPQWKCRLNIDMAHRAFFPSGNLAEILYGKYGDGMYDQSTWRRMAEDILSLRVEARHYKNEGIFYCITLILYDAILFFSLHLVLLELSLQQRLFLLGQYVMVCSN